MNHIAARIMFAGVSLVFASPSYAESVREICPQLHPAEKWPSDLSGIWKDGQGTEVYIVVDHDYSIAVISGANPSAFRLSILSNDPASDGVTFKVWHTNSYAATERLTPATQEQVNALLAAGDEAVVSLARKMNSLSPVARAEEVERTLGNLEGQITNTSVALKQQLDSPGGTPAEQAYVDGIVKGYRNLIAAKGSAFRLLAETAKAMDLVPQADDYSPIHPTTKWTIRRIWDDAGRSFTLTVLPDGERMLPLAYVRDLSVEDHGALHKVYLDFLSQCIRYRMPPAQ